MKNSFVVRDIFKGEISILGCEVSSSGLDMGFSHISIVNSNVIDYVMDKKSFDKSLASRDILSIGDTFGLVIGNVDKYKVGDIIKPYLEDSVRKVLEGVTKGNVRKVRCSRSKSEVSLLDLEEFFIEDDNGLYYCDVDISKDMLDEDNTIEIITIDVSKHVKTSVMYFKVLICTFDDELKLIKTEVYINKRLRLL